MYVCMYDYINRIVYVCMHLCIYAGMCVCVCACMYMCKTLYAYLPEKRSPFRSKAFSRQNSDSGCGGDHKFWELSLTESY